MFSVFSFSNNKFNPNGPVVQGIRKPNWVYEEQKGFLYGLPSGHTLTLKSKAVVKRKNSLFSQTGVNKSATII